MKPHRAHKWSQGRPASAVLQWHGKDAYHDMSSDRRYTATSIYRNGHKIHQAWYRKYANYHERAEAYLLGTFDTLDEAKAACQYHRDNYVRFK